MTYVLYMSSKQNDICHAYIRFVISEPRPKRCHVFSRGLPRKRACQEFGKVSTNMVLENRLIFGSVSSNKTHFEMGIKDMLETRRRYGNVLSRLVTKKLPPTDFEKAFKPESEDIKTIICFKWR